MQERLRGGQRKAAGPVEVDAVAAGKPRDFEAALEPRDYLFAHTLALVALAKGDRSASWIASASLDRYLHSIGRPQIFGTGFGADGKDQGAFDRGLVSDALRRELNVPALADQREVMEQLLRK